MMGNVKSGATHDVAGPDAEQVKADAVRVFKAAVEKSKNAEQ